MSEADLSPRVGWGFDAHAINDQPPLVLGGVVVSNDCGVAATSDGDVLVHAIADALLGAASLGDIGEHFPSDDPGTENLDSMFMLRHAATLVVAAGWQANHVDATVIAEEIRIAPFREAIRESVGPALGLEATQVSIKATSTDGLGFIGRSEGLAAIAVVTLRPLS